MKENEDNIEDLFGERFSNDEAPVSPRVWANIEKTLPSKTKGGIWNSWNIILLSLLGVLAIGFLGWFAFKTSDRIGPNETIANNADAIGKKKETKKENFISDSQNSKLTDSIVRNTRKSETVNAVNTLSSDKARTNDTYKKPLVSTTIINTLKDTASTNKEEIKNNKVKGTQLVNNSTSKVYYKKKFLNADLASVRSQNDNSGNYNSAVIDSLISPNSKKNTTKNNTKLESSSRNKIALNKNSTIAAIDTTKMVNSPISVPIKNSSIDLQTATIKKDSLVKSYNSIVDSENNDANKVISSSKNSINNNLTDAITKSKDMLSETILIDKNRIDLPSNAFISSSDHKSKNIIDSSDNNLLITKGGDMLDVNDSVIKKDKDNSFLVTNTLPSATIDSLKKISEDSNTVKSLDSTGNVAKEIKDKLRIPKKWSFDLLITPMLTGAATRAVGSTSDNKAVVSDKNKQDNNLFNFSVGAVVNYSILPRFSISTGLIYSGYTEKYKFKNTLSYDSVTSNDTVKEVIFIDSMGQMIPRDTFKIVTNIENLKNDYSSSKVDRYSFLSIPITISYILIDKQKFALSSLVGMKINMLLSGVTYVRNATNTDLVVESSGYSKISLSYMASFGMEYKLKPTLSLLAQPVINYNATSLFKQSSSLSQKPYSFGLSIGLRLRF